MEGKKAKEQRGKKREKNLSGKFPEMNWIVKHDFPTPLPPRRRKRKEKEKEEREREREKRKRREEEEEERERGKRIQRRKKTKRFDFQKTCNNHTRLLHFFLGFCFVVSSFFHTN